MQRQGETVDRKGPLMSVLTPFCKQQTGAGGLKTQGHCILCFRKIAGGGMKSGQAWRAAWRRMPSETLAGGGDARF